MRPTARRPNMGGRRPETERLLLSLPGTCVVRFTKVLGRANSLLSGWAEALRAGETIRPFSDMRMAPVPLDFAIEALVAVAAARAAGVVQVSADEDITYAAAARLVADQIDAPIDLVREIRAAESGVAIEHRPRAYHA